MGKGMEFFLEYDLSSSSSQSSPGKSQERCDANGWVKGKKPKNGLDDSTPYRSCMNWTGATEESL